MDLHDLKAFMDVVEHRSFTKAAEHSYLTQPSLSKTIKKLEEELQITLFHRSTRVVQLTDAGQILYQQSQKVFSVMSELHDHLDALRESKTGKIKIGIPPLIGTLFFPKIAAKFHRHYPNIRLELIELGAKLIMQLVDQGDIDLGIVVLPVDEEKFTISPFIQDEFVLFIHCDHPLASHQSITLYSLKEEKFILFSKDFTLHDYVIRVCTECGFTPKIAYESSQWDLIIELISLNLGIALLPKSIFLKQSNPNIKIIPIVNPTFLWKLGIITKKNVYQSFALKSLLTQLTTKDED